MGPKNRGLGMGLDALLGNSAAARSKQQVQEAPTQVASTTPKTEQDGALTKLSVRALQPGKYQPRKDMSQEALDELTQSIQRQGIIQPIVVREIAPLKYEIIAGERRWRAARQAGLEQVPCVIRQVEDDSAVAIALIENIQREDLNAMEEAVALQRLLTEFELTQQQVAEVVGKSRSTVTNLLRLNSLDDSVKRMLEHGDIEMGHARALLALDNDAQLSAARTVAQKGLNVRETEQLVKKLQNPAPEKPAKEPTPWAELPQQRLNQRFGKTARVQPGKNGKGKLVIDFQNPEDLERLLNELGA